VHLATVSRRVKTIEEPEEPDKAQHGANMGDLPPLVRSALDRDEPDHPLLQQELSLSSLTKLSMSNSEKRDSTDSQTNNSPKQKNNSSPHKPHVAVLSGLTESGRAEALRNVEEKTAARITDEKHEAIPGGWQQTLAPPKRRKMSVEADAEAMPAAQPSVAMPNHQQVAMTNHQQAIPRIDDARLASDGDDSRGDGTRNDGTRNDGARLDAGVGIECKTEDDKRKRNDAEKRRIQKIKNTVDELREELASQNSIPSSKHVCKQTVLEIALAQLKKLSAQNQTLQQRITTDSPTPWGPGHLVDYHSVFQHVPTPMALLTTRGDAITMNAAFFALTGIDLAKRNVTMFDLTQADGLPQMISAMIQLTTGQSAQVTVPMRLPCKNGVLETTGTISVVTSGVTALGFSLVLPNVGALLGTTGQGQVAYTHTPAAAMPLAAPSHAPPPGNE